MQGQKSQFGPQSIVPDGMSSEEARKWSGNPLPQMEWQVKKQENKVV